MVTAQVVMSALFVVIVIVYPAPFGANRIDFADVYPTNPREGDTVTFTCESIYAYRTNCEIVWSKNGEELTRNNNFVDADFGNRTDTRVEWLRYKIELTIGNVSRRDTGVYTCSVYRQDFSTYYYNYYSYSSDYFELSPDVRPITVNVSYYPNSRFPMCAVRSNLTSTNLICISETGNPAVFLHWMVVSEMITYYLPMAYEDDGHLNSEFTIKNWQIRSTDVFTCTVNSSEFSLSRSCSLYGHDIFHAHIVPPSLTVQASNAAEFTCQANVEPIDWLWKTKPQISQLRQHLSASQLRIEPVIAEDNGTSVSCYALFEDPWLQANAELTVLPNNHDALGGLSPGSKSERQGNSNLLWIALFVIVLTALVISVTVNIICYRNTKNSNPPISLPLKSTLADELKVHNDMKVKTTDKEEEYTDLNLGNEASKEYTGLNVGAMSARYVNTGFNNTSNNGDTDAELYDYPEQDDQIRSKQDEEIYLNV